MIERIYEAVELIKTYTSKNYCLISELAKELKESKIKITKYILDNPKLFFCETIYSYKDKKVKREMFGNKYWDTISIKNRNLGMGILHVYLEPKYNYKTQEWLDNQIVNHKKYIYISELNNYGHIYGYYINVDKEDSMGYHLWRNNKEKLSFLKENGYLSEGNWYIGGFGDSASGKQENCILLEQIKRLMKEGWEINKINPLSK